MGFDNLKQTKCYLPYQFEKKSYILSRELEISTFHLVTDCSLFFKIKRLISAE